MSRNMSALNRVSLSLKKPSLKPGKHKKLNENWFDIREPVKDGMKFNVKYIGMTLVDEPTGEKMSSDAVQRIFDMDKISLKKLRKVLLTISPSGIKVHDQAETNLIDDIPVYRISFCTVVKQHSKIFAFVAQNATSDVMECYAYLCNTRKEARSLTVTVAQSFKLALEMFEDEAKSEIAETKTAVVEVSTDFQEKSDKRSIPGIAEKKYHRISSATSFEQGKEEPAQMEERKELNYNEFDLLQITNEEPKNEEFKNAFSDIFDKRKTQQTTQVIVPLRPPPSVTRTTDKASPRRTQARISSNEKLLEVAMSQNPEESFVNVSTADDLDQGFADLALSRTQETPNSSTNSSQLVYPPSNPFSNPSNPFYT